MTTIYAPLKGFLIYLVQGWRFAGLVVEPMTGPNGAYSVLMVWPASGEGAG